MQGSEQTGRSRGASYDGHGLMNNSEVTIEDLTVMKLMEEIMELDQEIKMKQKWVNTRMKMLHKILPKQSTRTTAIAEDFLLQLQPEYPHKISVTYENPAAIPLRQADVFGEPIPMNQADVYDSPIEMNA